MGKDGGAMTAKAIGKRIKARGLGKLKFYCQMCQKQCRDANGFKMHCETEGHQRKMLQLGAAQSHFRDEFSRQFHEGMLDVIGRRFRNSRVLANVAYNEYIKDPHHTHMTGTQWETLGSYMKYLAQEGFVTLEDTPKGLFCRYVDRDPEALSRQRELQKLRRAEGAGETEEDALLRDLDKRSKLVRKLDERAQQQQQQRGSDAGQSASGADQVSFALKPELASASHNGGSHSRKRDIFDSAASSAADSESAAADAAADGPLLPSTSSSERPSKRRRKWDVAPTPAPAVPKTLRKKNSALEEIRAAEEARKDAAKRKENWVAPGIVVTFTDAELADGRFLDQKCVVERVLEDDEFVAVVRMLELGSVLEVDQDMLETVIPALGGSVRVVNGAYRGEDATLLAVYTDSYNALLRLDSGPHIGDNVTVDYEDFSKRAPTPP